MEFLKQLIIWPADLTEQPVFNYFFNPVCQICKYVLYLNG